MTPSNNPAWKAVFHNELEKLWAHRGRTLVIAFLLMVLGGTFLTYQSYQSQQAQIAGSIRTAHAEVVQWERQVRHATGAEKQQLEASIHGTQSYLRQAKAHGDAINEAQNLADLKVQSKHEPAGVPRGTTLEQLALARAMLAHGIKFDNPNVPTGFGFIGSVFASTAMLLFGLVAAGLASDRVSAELEGGTWGVLLLHAPRRATLYWGKLAASLVMTWLFMLAVAVGFFALISVVVGMGVADTPVLVGVHVKVLQPHAPLAPTVQVFHTIPQWGYDLLAVGLAMLAVGALVTISLALSLLTRSTVFSLIVSAVLVISTVLAEIVARFAGWLAVIDPAVHLPLIGDWTGQLAMQYTLPALSLPVGMAVLLAWAAAALAAGVTLTRRLDL